MQNNRIRITVGNIGIRAIARNTPTALAVLEALPMRSEANTWGQEVYFPVAVASSLEPDAKDVVVAGEIAFWVEGHCIAIGFGPTPLSEYEEIRLAAITNIWADAIDDVTMLMTAAPGDEVLLDWDI